MKSSVLILALAALVFSSCTSAYKTGQTPDDVYYSPARPQDEYVQVDKRDDARYYGSDEYYEDRYLRMRVQNRYRWSPLDDYYLNSPYAYNYNFYSGYNAYGGWNNPYNSYWCWNNYYNPYYSSYYPGYSHYYPGGGVIIKNPVTYTRPSRPIVFNSNSYGTPASSRSAGNRIMNSYNSNSGGSGYRYNNTNSNSNGGSFSNGLKRVFSNSNSSSNNNSSNSNSTPSRSYNPSSSSSSSSSGSRSSSSSSSSGSSSGGSRPAR
jgi:hypothetical protein